jgi:four helix bundle protein
MAIMDDEGKTRIKSHRDLVVWQKAKDLAVLVYKATNQFPKEETYSLTSQVRRAVVSIPANIAEGKGRRLPREFIQFLGNSRGSSLELDTRLEIALRLGDLTPHQHSNIQSQVQEVGRLIHDLLHSLTSDI